MVNKAVGNTVWLENGQRWNVRRCLLHRSTVRSSKPLLVPSGVSSSIANPDADDDSGVLGPVFEFVRQQQQQVRRSQ